MAPRVAAVHAEAGLVDMNDGSALPTLSRGVHKRGELRVDDLAGPENCPFAHDRPEKIGADLADPRKRDTLILGKVDEIAEKSRSILGGRRDMGRSRSGDRCRTGRTADFGQTVFRHLKAGRGKIKDLPSFMAHDREMGEIFSAGAACHGNLHDRVGSFHPQEGVSFVAGLTSGLLP